MSYSISRNGKVIAVGRAASDVDGIYITTEQLVRLADQVQKANDEFLQLNKNGEADPSYELGEANGRTLGLWDALATITGIHDAPDMYQWIERWRTKMGGE